MTRGAASLACGLLLAAVGAHAAGLSGHSGDTLSGSEQRGKNVYLGIGVAESGIKARVGSPPAAAPAVLLACVNCHGRDGKGKPEGRIVPSDITWDALTKPYGVTHPSGRTHPPYTERLLVRAICMGLDPAGNELHPTMPRFQMSREDVGALIGYLKKLTSDADPGLSESAIRIGTIVPAGGAPAAAGRTASSVISAYVDALNRQGGIYGRRLELAQATLALDAPDADIQANFDRFISERRPFAMVGSVITGAEQSIVAAAERQHIPFVGPLTLWPEAAAASTQTFYLLSGVQQQARALLDFEKRRSPESTPAVALVYSQRTMPAAAIGQVQDAARRLGWNAVHAIDLDRDAPRMSVERLKTEPATTRVLLLADGRAALEFARACAEADWTPLLLVPGALASNDILAIHRSSPSRILIAVPSVPSDQTNAGSAEYRALADTYRLPAEEMASQIAALCSAKVLTQGLKLAGKALSRSTLIEALEGLADFDTGLMPRIGFGPNRRIGAPGAYIVEVDPAAQRFKQVSQWVDIE